MNSEGAVSDFIVHVVFAVKIIKLPRRAEMHAARHFPNYIVLISPPETTVQQSPQKRFDTLNLWTKAS